MSFNVPFFGRAAGLEESGGPTVGELASATGGADVMVTSTLIANRNNVTAMTDAGKPSFA